MYTFRRKRVIMKLDRPIITSKVYIQISGEGEFTWVLKAKQNNLISSWNTTAKGYF